jgi:hypothetical protein
VVAVKTTTTVKGKTTAKATTSNSTIIASSDVNGVSKNVEVFSQGQKIIGNNSMSINDLPEGTYLLKITNAPSKKITSK